MPNVGKTLARDLLTAAPGRAVLNALEMLLERDSYLLQVDANERSITHRLAIYLQQELPSLDVDCEYNKNGVDTKMISPFSRPITDTDTNAKTVYPDIIAHRRGDRYGNNYLVIEVKKDTCSRSDGRDVDLDKLYAYVHQLNYQFALFVELQTGDRPGVASMQWVYDDERG